MLKLMRFNVPKVLMLLISSAVMLTGCSSSVPEGPYYYQLPLTLSSSNEAKGVTSKTGNNLPVIWVEPIILSSQLAQRNIVYQTSDVNFTLAQNNLWASALDEQLTLGLESSLANALPTYFVTRQANTQADYRLQVSITEFHPRYDGKVTVAGRFNITTRSGDVISQSFKKEALLAEDGYEETVRQLALLWQSQSNEIVKKMSTLH